MEENEVKELLMKLRDTLNEIDLKGENSGIEHLEFLRVSETFVRLQRFMNTHEAITYTKGMIWIVLTVNVCIT